MNVFISYTRNLDKLDGNVSNFQERLLNELRNINPSASIFFDKDDINPGDDFSDKLIKALEVAEIFMPIITPAWLVSPWCRKEFSSYKNNRNGRSAIVVPIEWVKSDAFNENSDDPIAREVARKQYQDWSKIRLLDHNDSKIQEACAKLADNLKRFFGFRFREIPDQGVSAHDYRHALSDLTSGIEKISPKEADKSPMIKSVVRSVWKAVDMTNKHLNAVKGKGSGDLAPDQDLIDAWNSAAMEISSYDLDLAYLLRAKATFWSNPSRWNDKEENDKFDISMTNLSKVSMDIMKHIDA